MRLGRAAGESSVMEFKNCSASRRTPTPGLAPTIGGEYAARWEGRRWLPCSARLKEAGDGSLLCASEWYWGSGELLALLLLPLPLSDDVDPVDVRLEFGWCSMRGGKFGEGLAEDELEYPPLTDDIIHTGHGREGEEGERECGPPGVGARQQG